MHWPGRESKVKEPVKEPKVKCFVVGIAGSCPRCGEQFRLGDSVLTGSGGKHVPDPTSIAFILPGDVIKLNSETFVPVRHGSMVHASHVTKEDLVPLKKADEAWSQAMRDFNIAHEGIFGK